MKTKLLFVALLPLLASCEATPSATTTNHLYMVVANRIETSTTYFVADDKCFTAYSVETNAVLQKIEYVKIDSNYFVFAPNEYTETQELDYFKVSHDVVVRVHNHTITYGNTKTIQTYFVSKNFAKDKGLIIL